MRKIKPLGRVTCSIAIISVASGPAGLGWAQDSSVARRTSTEVPVENDKAHDDGSQAERSASLLTRKLKALAKLLESGIDESSLVTIVGENGRATSLLLSAGDVNTKHIAGFRIKRSVNPPTEERAIEESLRALSVSLTEDDGKPRVDFKIVGMTRAVTDRWTADVRVEVMLERADQIRQQTSHWQVEFDIIDGGEDSRISRIKLMSLDQIDSPRRTFEDCTASLLDSDEALQAQLARGAGYWFGRLDAVGESQFMGHNGLAVGDVNGDNLDDLYVAMGTGLPNKLLVQQTDGTVRDRAVEANVAWLDDTKGVAFADLDNDGDQDLVLAMGPSLVVAVNDGTGVFERFISVRAATPASFYSLALADYDGDGDLDIYGTRYVKIRYGTGIPRPFHDANNGPRNLLIRNDGNHRYSDATAESGLDANNTRFSAAAAWADYDNDGDPDLYVANDFGRNNLYRNDAGHFIDVAAEANAEDQAAGMGVSWADYDLDGDLDLHVSNMFSAAGRRVSQQGQFGSPLSRAARSLVRGFSLGNTLLTNKGDGTFSDQSHAAGIRMGRWAWGARFVDVNNDGYDDLVVPNGFLTNADEHDL